MKHKKSHIIAIKQKYLFIYFLPSHLSVNPEEGWNRLKLENYTLHLSLLIHNVSGQLEMSRGSAEWGDIWVHPSRSSSGYRNYTNLYCNSNKSLQRMFDSLDPAL